jgi:hypothetical protein
MTVPAEEALKDEFLENQPEASYPTHDSIRQSKDHDISVEHEAHDLIAAENIAMLAPIFSSQFYHVDSSPQPEQSEETMKRRVGAVYVLPIKSSKLPSEDQITEFASPFLCRSWVSLLNCVSMILAR